MPKKFATATTWVDTEGRKRTEGVMGGLEHAATLIGEPTLFRLLEYATSDLLEFAAFVQQYAHGRDCVALAERVGRLEARAKKRMTRRARKAA